jgi:hypothetical protein
MESRWTPETSENDFKGQNSMACDFFYIIGKLLKRRCLKWLALLIRTLETQVMAKRRVGSQVASSTPNQKKSGIDLIYLFIDGVRHTVGKFLTRATTLFYRISIRGLFAKLWGSKVVRIPTGGILGLPFGREWESQKRKAIWM